MSMCSKGIKYLIRINFKLTKELLVLSVTGTHELWTYLHRSCHTDKGTSRHFPGQWHIPHMTPGNQTFPSSFPCQVALLSSCFYLQRAPQGPAPQRERLVWPLLGSLGPLYSAQSSPWWDHYSPVGSVSPSVVTACYGDKLKSLVLSGWASHTEFGDWLDRLRTMCGHWMCRKAVDRGRIPQLLQSCYTNYILVNSERFCCVWRCSHGEEYNSNYNLLMLRHFYGLLQPFNLLGKQCIITHNKGYYLI